MQHPKRVLIEWHYSPSNREEGTWNWYSRRKTQGAHPIINSPRSKKKYKYFLNGQCEYLEQIWTSVRETYYYPFECYDKRACCCCSISRAKEMSSVGRSKVMEKSKFNAFNIDWRGLQISTPTMNINVGKGSGDHDSRLKRLPGFVGATYPRDAKHLPRHRFNINEDTKPVTIWTGKSAWILKNSWTFRRAKRTSRSPYTRTGDRWQLLFKTLGKSQWDIVHLIGTAEFGA